MDLSPCRARPPLAIALAASGLAAPACDAEPSPCKRVDEVGIEVTAQDADDPMTPPPDVAVGAGPYTITLTAHQTTYVNIEHPGVDRALLLVDQVGIAGALEEATGNWVEFRYQGEPYEECPELIPETFELEFTSFEYSWLYFAPPQDSYTLWLMLIPLEDDPE